MRSISPEVMAAQGLLYKLMLMVRPNPDQDPVVLNQQFNDAFDDLIDAAFAAGVAVALENPHGARESLAILADSETMTRLKQAADDIAAGRVSLL